MQIRINTGMIQVRRARWSAIKTVCLLNEPEMDTFLLRTLPDGRWREAGRFLSDYFRRLQRKSC